MQPPAKKSVSLSLSLCVAHHEINVDAAGIKRRTHKATSVVHTYAICHIPVYVKYKDAFNLGDGFSFSLFPSISTSSTREQTYKSSENRSDMRAYFV